MPSVHRRVIDDFSENKFGFYALIHIGPKLMAAALLVLPLLFGFIQKGTQIWGLSELFQGGYGVGGHRIQI